MLKLTNERLLNPCKTRNIRNSKLKSLKKDHKKKEANLHRPLNPFYVYADKKLTCHESWLNTTDEYLSTYRDLWL